MIANTDEMENLEYSVIGLLILNLVLTIYKIFAQRLQTFQILAAQSTMQNNSPMALKRHSQYSIAQS